MKTINPKKVKTKLISLVLSVILLFFALTVKKVNFQILKLPYIIIIIVISLLLIIFSVVLSILKKELNEKYQYYYYQVLDFVQILVFAVALIQLVFLFWFFPATVQMNSMNPTLFEEDNLIIKVGNSRIERFDIVVVDVKNMDTFLDPDSLIIKRVIGLPGDNFLYRNGKLILIKDNKEIEINEPFLYDAIDSFRTGNGFSTFTEDFTLANKCSINGKVCDFSQGVVIPKDYYFIMGDNRGNNYSYDSRAFGLIHRSSIVGSAKYKISNFIKWHKLK